MPDRDLDITKFSYVAYRKLKKTLGEFDAVVECNEIAIREFIEKAQSEDSRRYIEQLSHKHNIVVNEVDFIKFSSRIRQYYLASVSQQSEQFLKDFKGEWGTYFYDKEWLDKGDGETVLQNVSRNLSLSLPSNLTDFYEYYRLIRNYMSHTDRDINRINARYKKILKNDNEFLKTMHLHQTPNPLESIDFDDFLILTNIVKHIAFTICYNSKPDNKRIAEILFNLSKQDDGRSYKGMKKLKNDNIRYENALRNFAITKFGRFSTKDIEEITKEFKSLLA